MYTCQKLINITWYWYGQVFPNERALTWLVWTEMGNCPSTTSLYSLETGAPKLTMLWGREGKEEEESGEEKMRQKGRGIFLAYKFRVHPILGHATSVAFSLRTMSGFHLTSCRSRSVWELQPLAGKFAPPLRWLPARVLWETFDLCLHTLPQRTWSQMQDTLPGGPCISAGPERVWCPGMERVNGREGEENYFAVGCFGVYLTTPRKSYRN